MRLPNNSDERTAMNTICPQLFNLEDLSPSLAATDYSYRVDTP